MDGGISFSHLTTEWIRIISQLELVTCINCVWMRTWRIHNWIQFGNSLSSFSELGLGFCMQYAHLSQKMGRNQYHGCVSDSDSGWRYWEFWKIRQRRPRWQKQKDNQKAYCARRWWHHPRSPVSGSPTTADETRVYASVRTYLGTIWNAQNWGVPQDARWD